LCHHVMFGRDEGVAVGGKGTGVPLAQAGFADGGAGGLGVAPEEDEFREHGLEMLEVLEG